MSTTAPSHSDDSRPPSEVVVSSVAAHKGVEQVALPPLYEALDPDALDALFTTPGGAAGRVTFDYAGCTVECASDGSVDVRDAAA
ncbi:hypothetical protein HZS55_20640 [Halosimplex rubrum]|uniref:Halobacterial output domain-containing protein n=1 Tax=Halosimplex rubrum TaxID=869889 RepID=A0A7D5TP92_9EURY|nr:HalOD1 output domain-containing protein [Halosimplex rubrum]QLH79552.1 hypothetical protein HZS55_20640 [Halosimplex rubrum]